MAIVLMLYCVVSCCSVPYPNEREFVLRVQYSLGRGRYRSANVNEQRDVGVKLCGWCRIDKAIPIVTSRVGGGRCHS